MVFAKAVLLSAVGVALLAYFTRPKWPESASHHGIKNSFGLYVDFAEFMGKAAGYIGLSPINVSRTVFDTALYFDKTAPDVQEYITHMDGVEVTVYKPVGDTDQLRRGIVHIHGGGWTFLSPAIYAQFIRELTRQSQSVIVSVNYRQAPEFLFPASVEDCLKVTRFFLKNAEKYGADGKRIALKGDSAGGNMALAIALELATGTDPPANELKLISVDSGALQAVDLNLPSYLKHEFGPGFLNKPRMIWYWANYAFGHQDYHSLFYTNDHLSEEVKTFYKDRISANYLPKEFLKGWKDSSSSGSSKSQNSKVQNEIKDIITNRMFSPLLATDEDLAKLPPTYVLNVEFDTLRDDGLILLERLKSVGVTVEHSFLSAEEHAFIIMTDFDENCGIEVTNFCKFFNKIIPA